MIIRDREGQTNKPDTLIGERDGSFILSTANFEEDRSVSGSAMRADVLHHSAATAARVRRG
jgi:hypothetical protein